MHDLDFHETNHGRIIPTDEQKFRYQGGNARPSLVANELSRSKSMRFSAQRLASFLQRQTSTLDMLRLPWRGAHQVDDTFFVAGAGKRVHRIRAMP